MVERLLCKQDVVGSIPSGSTIYYTLWFVYTQFWYFDHFDLVNSSSLTLYAQDLYDRVKS